MDDGIWVTYSFCSELEVADGDGISESLDDSFGLDAVDCVYVYVYVYVCVSLLIYQQCLKKAMYWSVKSSTLQCWPACFVFWASSS